MQQNLLKVQSDTEKKIIIDTAQQAENSKISDSKTNSNTNSTQLSNQDNDVSQKLEKQFPIAKLELSEMESQLLFQQSFQISTEISQNQRISQSNTQNQFSQQQKLASKTSLQRKHTIKTNIPTCIQDPSGLQFCLKNNQRWAGQMVRDQPDFFSKLIDIQKPKYLWIGCADSRVPANQIVGLKPGELFVHRNIANIISPSDINVLAVIQYAVEYLQVQDVIITGHYGCGGIQSSFSKTDYGILEAWLSNLRQLKARYNDILQDLQTQSQKMNKMVQLNVQSQVLNLSRIPIIQNAWKKGKKLRIHGLVYRLEDGILHDLKVSMDCINHIPHEYRIVE